MTATVTIGFDLGHGEMALTRQAVTGRAEPEVIEIHGRRSQVTAVAETITPDGAPTVLIGEDAVEAFDMAAPEAAVLEIGFKGHPGRNPKAQAYVPLLATAVYQYILDHNILADDESPYFFVGYPAGWDDAERDAYAALLAQSRIPRLMVVPESRAALAHAAATGGLTVDQIRGPVLVIDIGSSTTDFTLQRSLKSETSSFGVELGAALIDRALLARVLPQQRDAEALQAIVDQYPSYRNRLELVARKAKEGYFKRLDSDLYRNTGQRPVHKEIEDIQRRYVFRVTVDGPLMDEVLRQPLAELGGRSWQDAFHAAAVEARRRWLDAEGLGGGVVLATGGASRMDFIAEVCKEVFTGWRYVVGTEPDLAIARGLARWGRNYLRTAAFDREAEVFLRDDVPALVAEAAPDLIDRLSGPLADALIAQVIQPALRDWRGHQVRTLADLEATLPARAEAWLQGEAARQVVNDAVADWLRPLLLRIHDGLRPICARYGIAGDPFAILVDFKPGGLATAVSGQDANWGLLTNLVRDLVGGTSAAVLGVLLVLAQGALFRLGPAGWAVAAVVTAVALLAGKGVGEGYVKTMNVPYPARGPLLSEGRIRDVSADLRPRLQQGIHDTLQASNLTATVTAEVEAGLREMLAARVAEVRLLIG